MVGPAWNYILLRGTYTPKNTPFSKIFTPIRTFLLISGVCIAIETSQYYQIYEAYFDPYDYLAYISLILPFFLVDIRLENSPH